MIVLSGRDPTERREAALAAGAAAYLAKPVTSQDVVETKVFAEKIQWANFFATQERSQFLQDEADKATVMVVLSRMSARLPMPRGGEEKRLRAVAGKCF